MVQQEEQGEEQDEKSSNLKGAMPAPKYSWFLHDQPFLLFLGDQFAWKIQGGNPMHLDSLNRWHVPMLEAGCYCTESRFMTKQNEA